MAITDRDKATVDTAAAIMGPDLQSRSYYAVRAADDLGIPYFTLLFAGLFLLVIVIKLHWSDSTTNIVFIVYQVIINGIFAYKLFQKYRLAKKPK